jgi:hypothetical protein
VAILDSSGSKILVHPVGTSTLKAHAIPKLAPGTTASFTQITLPAMLLLSTSDGGSLLLQMGAAAAAPSLVRAVDAADTHVFAATASREGRAVLALATLDTAAPAASALKLSLLQIDTDGSHADWSAPDSLPYAPAPANAPWLFLGGGGAAVHRARAFSALRLHLYACAPVCLCAPPLSPDSLPRLPVPLLCPAVRRTLTSTSALHPPPSASPSPPPPPAPPLQL